MAEWTKAAVLKTAVAMSHRGFESLSLRQEVVLMTGGGARVDDWGRLLSGCGG